MCPGPYAKLAEQAERYDEIAEQSSSRLRTHHSDEVEKLRQQARDALLQEAQSGKLLEVLHQARHSQPMSLISFGSRPRGVVAGSASWQTVGNTSPKLRAATNSEAEQPDEVVQLRQQAREALFRESSLADC